MEKIRENIYRIGIPLKGSPLKEINSYLIRGTDRDLLIDTGYRREECITIMKDALKQLGSSSDRLDIFLTHVHSDHTGMVMEIAGPDSRIFMHEKDLAFLKEVLDGTNGVRTRHVMCQKECRRKSHLRSREPIRQNCLLSRPWMTGSNR